MSEPSNQKPPDLRRDQLPAWATAALEAMREANAAGAGFRAAPGDARWYVPERGLALWSSPHRVGLLWLSACALLPIGFALLLWAMLGLRSAEVVAWRWALGAALTIAGACGLTLVRRRLQQPNFKGLLIVPEGLVVIDGARHRVVSRAEIHDVTFEAGRLITVYGPEHRGWCHYSALPDTPGHRVVEERFRALEEWKRTGVVPPPARTGAPHRPPPPAFAPTAKVLAAVAGLLGFLWLTLVLPATSDSGLVARRFVDSIADKDFDAAHQLLSDDKQRALPRASFEAQLPAELRAARGLTVNSIAGGVGVAVGSTACVDGWLDGVPGRPLHAFELVGDGDSLRIAEFRPGSCRRH